MHKITITQNSTGRQMDYMAENLQERYKTTVFIQRSRGALESGRQTTRYWINVMNITRGFKNNWGEVQTFYKELMRSERG